MDTSSECFNERKGKMGDEEVPLWVLQEEIQKSFDDWTKAWNEGDTKAYLNAYADVPTVRYVSGKNVSIGKETIVKLLETRGGAKGTLSTSGLEIDIIPTQYKDAICFGHYELQLPNKDDTSTTTTHNGCFTVHLRKLESSWKIISDHSS